jgi:hypothetical protein
VAEVENPRCGAAIKTVQFRFLADDTFYKQDIK